MKYKVHRNTQAPVEARLPPVASCSRNGAFFSPLCATLWPFYPGSRDLDFCHGLYTHVHAYHLSRGIRRSVSAAVLVREY